MKQQGKVLLLCAFALFLPSIVVTLLSLRVNQTKDMPLSVEFIALHKQYRTEFTALRTRAERLSDNMSEAEVFDILGDPNEDSGSKAHGRTVEYHANPVQSSSYKYHAFIKVSFSEIGLLKRVTIHDNIYGSCSGKNISLCCEPWTDLEMDIIVGAPIVGA